MTLEDLEVRGDGAAESYVSYAPAKLCPVGRGVSQLITVTQGSHAQCSDEEFNVRRR